MLIVANGCGVLGDSASVAAVEFLLGTVSRLLGSGGSGGGGGPVGELLFSSLTVSSSSLDLTCISKLSTDLKQ